MLNISTINAHCTKIFDTKTGICTIFSYNTPVLRVFDNGRDNSAQIDRLWAGYSKTTLSDINRAGFSVVFGRKMTKKEWESMNVVEN